ncbi:hypothetical protein AB6896_16200 [Rahnella inusitata]|uniref:hypothetical protein n=1 Tax=Rahnella inusitata TaxID=58169 RepID=UPI0039BE2888
MLKARSYLSPSFAVGLKNIINRENLYLLLWVLLMHYALGYQYKLIYVFSAYSGLLLLRYAAKIPYRFVVMVFTLAGALYAPVGINYGFPDINVIGSLMYTNTNEAHEFIGNIPAAAWLLSASVIVSGIATIVSSFTGHKNAPVTRSTYGFLVIFFVASALWSPLRQGRMLSSGLPEVRFVHDIYTSYWAVSDNNQYFARIMTTSNIWKPVSLPDQRKTYILVIGCQQRVKSDPLFIITNGSILIHRFTQD